MPSDFSGERVCCLILTNTTAKNSWWLSNPMAWWLSGFSHLHTIKEVLETVMCVHQAFKIRCSLFLPDIKMRYASWFPKANCCCCRPLTQLWPSHLLRRVNVLSCYSNDFTYYFFFLIFISKLVFKIDILNLGLFYLNLPFYRPDISTVYSY